jgi:hypothetical protein
MHKTTLPCLRLRGFLCTHTPDAFPAPASLSSSPTNYWGSLFFFAGACELALDAFPVLASPISVLRGLSLSSANLWGSLPVSGRLEEHKISPPMNLWTLVFVPDDLVGPDPRSWRTCTRYFLECVGGICSGCSRYQNSSPFHTSVDQAQPTESVLSSNCFLVSLDVAIRHSRKYG